MATNGPQDDPPTPAFETLRRLERRLDEASSAAERLIAEAAASAGRRRPPAAGWQAPEAADPAGSERNGDLELIVGLLQSVRDLIPPDLQRRVAEALREVLMALRALIDWYLERAETRRTDPVEVQDIPIV
jgi:hypothetical protein